MPLPQARADALRNLNLDGGFFQRLLRRDRADLPQADEQDFDLVLMERGVMPVLLQGLDALSRHLDKMNSKAELCGGPTGGGRPPFNPLTWLAQYLLRNHPDHVKDHRTPMYQQFRDLAAVERGRRCLLRRRGEFEEEWCALERELGVSALSLEAVTQLVQRLDAKWHLDGAFARQMPQDYSSVLSIDQGARGALFVDFWAWFEPYVWRQDLLRASAFEEAEERVRRAELEVQRAQSEALERERMKTEAVQKRRSLGEQFEAMSADMYINAEINRIINRGAVLEAEPREGSAAVKGEHVSLIVAMLGLWGFPVVDDDRSSSSAVEEVPPAEAEQAQDAQPGGGEAPPGDGGEATPPATPPAAAVRRRSSSALSEGGPRHERWGMAAQEAWECWVQMHGPASAPLQVDSAGLRALMDQEAFEDYLVRAYPLRMDAERQGVEEEEPRVVEVLGLGEDAIGDFLVEARDPDSGEQLHLAASDSEVHEIQLRLEKEGSQGQPVLAHVDAAGTRIIDLLPPTG